LSCCWAARGITEDHPGYQKARKALEREAAVAFENVADAIAARAPDMDRAGGIVSLSERTEILMISCPV
jgi:hypothetical protein